MDPIGAPDSPPASLPDSSPAPESPSAPETPPTTDAAEPPAAADAPKTTPDEGAGAKPPEFDGTSSFNKDEGTDRARQAALLGNDNGGYSPSAGFLARRGEDIQAGTEKVRDALHSGLDSITGKDSAAGRFFNGLGKSAVDMVTGLGDLAGGGLRASNDPEFRGRVADGISNAASQLYNDPGGTAKKVWDATKDAFEKDPAGASGYAAGTVGSLLLGGAGLAGKVGQGGRAAAEAAGGAERLAAAGAGGAERLAAGAAGEVGQGGRAAAEAAGGAERLAAGAGANPAAPAGRAADRIIPLGPQTAVGTRAMDVARTFYKNAGYTEREIADHMKGIDFTKPVTVRDLPPGTRLQQAQVPGRNMGNYFSDPGTSTRDLGIFHRGTSRQFPGELPMRENNMYRTDGRVQVLQSTAKDITDRWSTGRPRWQTGGGTQYFIPNSAKSGLRPSQF